MSDIHVGKITQSGSGKGKAQLIYHIPIDTPVSGIVPTPESVIASQLDQPEKDALAAGTLVEVAKDDIAVATWQTQAEVAAAIKANWQDAKTDYNNRYNFEYKFYGVTLDATS